MQCNFGIHQEGKRVTFCPSHSHEGIFMNGDDKPATMFCSHHRGIVEAKMTSGREVNQFGQFSETGERTTRVEAA